MGSRQCMCVAGCPRLCVSFPRSLLYQLYNMHFVYFSATQGHFFCLRMIRICALFDQPAPDMPRCRRPFIKAGRSKQASRSGWQAPGAQGRATGDHNMSPCTWMRRSERGQSLFGANPPDGDSPFLEQTHLVGTVPFRSKPP